jgi:hypothetical protein
VADNTLSAASAASLFSAAPTLPQPSPLARRSALSHFLSVFTGIRNPIKQIILRLPDFQTDAPPGGFVQARSLTAASSGVCAMPLA